MLAIRTICYCVSSWKLPRTYWAERDGKRMKICDRCYLPRVPRREPALTEDAADLAAAELANDCFGEG